MPVLGGTLCSRHPPPPAEQTPLSLAALKLLRAYRRLDIEAIAGLRLPREVEAEVESALRGFIRNVLERDARSLAFLDEVAHADARSGRKAGRSLIQR